MPLTKCGGCGKFLSPVDAARCSKCNATYHRACVGVPVKGPVASHWHCPECRKNVRRDNKAETPVRGNSNDARSSDQAFPTATPVIETATPVIATATPATMMATPVMTTATPAATMAMPAATMATPPTAVATPRAIDSPTLSARSPVLLMRSPVLGTAMPPMVVCGDGGNEDTEPLRDIQDFPQDVGSAFQLIMEELRTLRQEVLELRKELRRSNESSNTRMDCIEARLEALEDRPVITGSVDGVIEQLKRDLNDRDQELMANDIVIANLPESNAESTAHLVELIASKLGVKVEQRDIVSAERVGGRHIQATSPTDTAEPRPRALMVRLARRDLRDAFLDAARVRRGATTEDLGLAGPARRFFVNERLTKANQQLFRRTRAAAGLHGWRFVWTKRGRILVRKQPGDPTRRINSVDEMQKIIGPYTDTE